MLGSCFDLDEWIPGVALEVRADMRLRIASQAQILKLAAAVAGAGLAEVEVVVAGLVGSVHGFDIPLGLPLPPINEHIVAPEQRLGEIISGLPNRHASDDYARDVEPIQPCCPLVAQELGAEVPLAAPAFAELGCGFVVLDKVGVAKPGDHVGPPG